MKRFYNFLQLAVAMLIACTVFQCIAPVIISVDFYGIRRSNIPIYIEEEIKKLKTEL